MGGAKRIYAATWAELVDVVFSQILMHLVALGHDRQGWKVWTKPFMVCEGIQEGRTALREMHPHE
eukprot:6456169-Amphidinium_carterae.1